VSNLAGACLSELGAEWYVSPFYTSNEALIAAVVFLLLLLATEVGFHLGRRAGARICEKTQSEISIIQGSVLGVLGLLLAFTISMAVSRFELRKQLVLDEANAIGTSYLRTQLIPEPDRSYIADRLREYVGQRLRDSRAGNDVSILKNSTAIRNAREETHRLQNDFWMRAVSRAQSDPNPVKTGLLLQSLNEVIDLDAARWTAFNNHVPATVIDMNILVGLVAALLVGYTIGLAGQRNLFSVCLLAAAITITLLVIIDLDRSQQGLIRVTQQPLIDLEQELSSH
jgi:hypothetical protein